MSWSGFFNNVGKFAKGIGETVVGAPIGAFNYAQAVTADVSRGDNLLDAVVGHARDKQTMVDSGIADIAGSTAAAANSQLGQQVMAPIVWVGSNASRGIATAALAGDASQAQGTGVLGPLTNAAPWKAAWDKVNKGEDISAGQVLTAGFQQPRGDAGNIFSNAQANKDFEEYRHSTGGKILSGAVDIAATWYADPTMGIAKVAKMSRVGNTITDAAEAEQVFKATQAGVKPGVVGSVFGKGADTKAQRLGRTISSTDNMDASALAAHFKPVLERSGDAGALVDLLGQAGKIADLEVQRSVKANIMLSAAGSQAAREELIGQAPAVARAMQRATSAPAEFDALDSIYTVSNANIYARGDSLSTAAKAMATPENEAELVAYGRTLDRIHERLAQVDDIASTGGQEVIGRTALDRAKSAIRSRTAQDFVYQDAVSGRTVRVLHWAVGQRGRGTIATDDALHGQSELIDSLKRSKLYTGTEVRAKSNDYLSAPNQADRARMVENLHDEMLTRVANREGLSAGDLDELRASLKSAHNAGRKYSTTELEAARAAGKDRVVLNDPVSGSATSVKVAVLETQIRNSVSIPDTDMLTRLVREHKGTVSGSEKMTASVRAAEGGLSALNDVWRLGALARPGLLVRTQLDTQPRAAFAIGATAYMAQAMKGLGHAFNKKLSSDEVVQVSARAEDLARADGWLAQADSLERQADVLDGAGLMTNRSMADVAAGKFDEITGRFAGVQARMDTLGKQAAATQQRFDKRLVGADAKAVSAGAITSDHQALLDEIGSYEQALEGFGYKRRTGLMQRVTSAQDHLAGMKDDATSIEGQLAALRKQIEMASSPKARAALAARVAKLQAKRDQLHSTLRSMEDQANTWLERADGPTPTRDTPSQRLRDRADQIRTSAADLPTYETRKNRIGTTDQTIKLKGGSVKTRAYTDEQDMNETMSALLPGQETLSDALINLQTKKTAQIYENADDWKTYEPHSSMWERGYVRATDAMRNSHTANRVLQEADHPTVDLIKSLRNDRKVYAEWRKVRHGNEQFDSWLDRVVNYVDWHAPTPELRARLANGTRMEPAEVSKHFLPRSEKLDEAGNYLPTKAAAGDARAARMDIHGPAMSGIAPDTTGRNVVTEGLSKFVRLMSDKPDMMLGRHPMYTGRFFYHVKGLAQRELDRSGEVSSVALAQIETMAKHRAIKDVHQTMYNTAKHTGAHETMRAAVPFLGAWEDAMTSWSRIMYDDPAHLGTLTKVWTAPERMSMVVDENGKPVPWGGTAKQKFITIPLPGPLKDFVGASEFKFRKDSLNSIFQGEVPWVPGFGPIVQIPATEVLGRIYPELTDTVAGQNPLIRSMFPNGVPKRNGIGSDVFQSAAPGWIKKFHDSMSPDSAGYLTVFGSSVDSQIIAARKAGKPIPSRDVLIGNAVQAARNVSIVKGLSLGLFGLSGEGGNIADFYRSQYNDLRAHEGELSAQGKSLDQAFAEQHPEAAGLNFRLTKNNTGINATIAVQNRSRAYATQIAAHPESGWFFVGSDNLGGTFSQGVYNAQTSDAIGGANANKRRERVQAVGDGKSPGLVENSLAGIGWGEYQRISTKVDLILESRGLHSVNQKGAEDLRGIKRQFVDELRTSNPDWAKDYDTTDTGKVKRFIDEVARPSLTDSKMKTRSDIKALGEYMRLRDKAVALLAAKGVSSFKAGAADDMAAVLNQAGTELARQDTGFMQMWNRVLAKEVGG